MEKKLQRNLFRLIVGTLVILLLIGIALFYGTVQSILVDNMKRNNQSFADQVTASFETIMEQITDQVQKLSLYDNELLAAVEQRKVKASAARTLYGLLDSVVLSNRYLYSAYLYSPSEDLFYTSEWGGSRPRENFYDQAVVTSVMTGIVANVEPRLVSAPGGLQKLLASVVIPIPLAAAEGQPRCILSANIDVEKLYADILKKNNAAEGTQLYIYNKNNRILISQDLNQIGLSLEEVLGSQRSISDSTLPLNVLLNRPMAIQSVSTSAQLGWNFYLRTNVKFDFSRMLNQYVLIAGLLVFFCLAVGVSYVVIRRSTKPLNEVIFAYNEKLLRDILANTGGDQGKMLEQLAGINRNFPYEHFSVVALSVTGSHMELAQILKEVNATLEAPPERMEIRTVDMKPGYASIIFNFSGSEDLNEFFCRQGRYLEYLYSRLNERYPRQVYITVSSVKKGSSMLPVAYQECALIQEYKLSLEKHIVRFEEFIPGKGGVEYPIQLEKQILNNLMVGNSDGCALYLEKFLDEVLSGVRFSDVQVLNCVYQLQNAVLKKVSSLPISIKINSETDLAGFAEPRQIRDWLEEFLQSILTEINQKNSQDENILVDSIFHYIEENLTKDDFNLNNISYQFDLNRNYLTKLIKEKTGQTFNDYVNQKKVAIAKELLEDRSLTVEAVAHKIGFSYAHYFIKVFKASEGITPGQYRETLDDNKNAQI